MIVPFARIKQDPSSLLVCSLPMCCHPTGILSFAISPPIGRSPSKRGGEATGFSIAAIDARPPRFVSGWRARAVIRAPCARPRLGCPPRLHRHAERNVFPSVLDESPGRSARRDWESARPRQATLLRFGSCVG